MHSLRALRPRTSALLAAGFCAWLVSPLASAASEPSVEDKAAHVLNRLGYGPRPGEVARVAELGPENWIRLQLEPRTIPDPAADAALAGLTKLKIPRADLVETYQRETRERARLQRAQGRQDAEAVAQIRSEMREHEQAVVAQALGELQYAKLARAVLSERQLEQVLVDFWFNHFNVDARKQQVRATVVGYEQDTIRPHVFGNFRDLLGATAHSAAMLVYLDNFRSSREMELGPREQAAAERLRREVMGEDEMAPAADGENPAATAAAPATPAKRGLNENYGRELLELHTLGVDGGYAQGDVQEVARAFTGWTINPRNGDFLFRRAWHDNEPKKILGVDFAAGGGVKDGEKVLDLLATHPATAKRIATKLCQRFVADEPPAPLVERVAKAFLDSKGDLRATYEAIFFSPEFFAAEHMRSKTKSPFEFAASALRASGAELVEGETVRARLPLRAVEAGAALGRGGDRLDRMARKTMLLHLVELGQPPYVWGPPTGFPEDSTHWVSAGALVSRLNFSLALTGGQVADARVDSRRLIGSANADRPDEVVAALSSSVLGRGPSEGTRRVLIEQAAPARDGATALPDVPKLLALLLGSPEFQRR